jgi:hypothetical protein
MMLFCGSAGFAVQETDFSMNGAVLKEKLNGSEVWNKPDGTVITVFTDRSEAVLPDKTKIVKYSGGRRDVTTPDGRTVRIDDSKGIREYSTGKKISLQGSTPFGDTIPRIEKVQSKDPLVRMIYLPGKSDEQLYIESGSEKCIWEIKDFFDELYSRVRQKFINAAGAGNPYSGKAFDIVVSYCRYCKTGYCYGRDAAVVVEIIENGDVKKSFTLKDIVLRDKKRMLEFVSTVSDSVSVP